MSSKNQIISINGTGRVLTPKEIEARERVILALDGLDYETAKETIKELSPLVGVFKVHDLVQQYGPEVIEYIHSQGAECFWDIKGHDIPNTVKNYAYNATKKGVKMFNVHASGGLDMMQAAIKGIEAAIEEDQELRRPEVYGVTVLTSLDVPRLLHIYQPILPFTLEDVDFKHYFGIDEILKKEEKDEGSITPDEQKLLDEWYTIMDDYNLWGVLEKQVVHLAHMSLEAGLDGVICSAAELEILGNDFGDELKCVVPGISHPKTNKVGSDQKRSRTPYEALADGAYRMVIGRAILGSKKDNLSWDKKKQNAYEVLADIAQGL